MFSRSFHFCITFFLAATALNFAAEADFPDPAYQIVSTKLTDEEIKTCRKLFEQLASEDFDTRDQALSQLVAKGTAILPLAQEFANNANTEIATNARNLRQKLIHNYDGYIPTSPELSSALTKKIEVQFDGQNFLDCIKNAAKAAGASLALDPNLAIARPEIEGVLNKYNGTLKDLFLTYGQWFNLGAVPRGDVLYITKPDVAQRLQTQRHNFKWSELGLSRDEAERVSKAFSVFFPMPTTETHSSSEVFSIRGQEEAIARAARLIALLKPGSPDVILPANPQLATEDVSLSDKLARPISITLASEDPLNIIALLKKQNIDVFVAPTDDPSGTGRQEHPFDRDVDGGSPLRLALHDLPLGLVLRWVERRTKFPAGAQADMMLGYETGPGGRLQFRLQPKARQTLNGMLLSADVSFLYPRGAQPGAESDVAARKELLAAIESHLTIFPAHQERDIVVLRGRLFMQGQYATLARTLALVRQWRATNAPPPSPTWQETLDTRLRVPIDWEPAGMSAGKLLPTLRKLGKIDILLEEGPDGSSPSFQMTAEEAQLLPAGKYPLRMLLDELVKKAGAQWKAELGVVVITPKPADGK